MVLHSRFVTQNRKQKITSRKRPQLDRMCPRQTNVNCEKDINYGSETPPCQSLISTFCTRYTNLFNLKCDISFSFSSFLLRTCRQCCTENFRRPSSGNECNKCAGFRNTLSWSSLSNTGLQVIVDCASYIEINPKKSNQTNHELR